MTGFKDELRNTRVHEKRENLVKAIVGPTILIAAKQIKKGE